MVTTQARLDARVRPSTIVVGHQRWTDLLFLHWQIDPMIIQATLPKSLTVDTHEGAAYLGIVPFFMQRVRPRWLPPLPWLSWFLELNVRTYVHDEEGRPGVWFYSLDCNQPLAVWLARKTFHLPYFHAAMAATQNAERIDYCSQRKSSPEPRADYAWQAHGSAREAAVGTLEFFLVERYYLFAQKVGGQTKAGQVHHTPYRIRDARMFAHSIVPAQQAGFALGGDPVSVLCADVVDVSVYRLQSIGGATGKSD